MSAIIIPYPRSLRKARIPARRTMLPMAAPFEPDLARRFFFLAKRFVAGETIDSALAAVAALNGEGLEASLDFLGEDCRLLRTAEENRDVYLALLDAIAQSGARTNVSVKLTALGVLIDEETAYRNLSAIVARAARLADPFVRIDMEGSAVTDATLRTFERLYAERQNVGPVLQAYLKRTPADAERLIALGARVRLCKGAYREPDGIAHHAPPIVRREYLRLAEALLTRGRFPAIATHDEAIIAAVTAFAAEQRIAKERFEFQLLYGVRPGLARALATGGYRVRIYVPFGTHWAGYFYRRVTERRENAVFALRSLLGR
jgi:proline dehydrogenase